VRGILLTGGEIPDRRNPDGSAVTNYFPRSGAGGRERAYAVLPLRRSGLSPDFLLGMKQNAHYTCVIEELIGQPDFDLVAVVRHPLATIRSWRSATDLPISRGRLPAAERLWPELVALAESTDDVLLRQVHIYRMFCERYLAFGARLRLLRYEDIVRDKTLLSTPYARGYVREIALHADTTVADAAETALIGAYLRQHCPVAYQLYPDLRESG